MAPRPMSPNDMDMPPMGNFPPPPNKKSMGIFK